MQEVKVLDEGGRGMGVAVGGGVLVELGGIAVEASVPGSVPECSQVGGVGVGGGCGPEVDWRHLVGAMPAAVLVEVVGQSVQRALPGPGPMPGSGGAGAAVPLVAGGVGLDGGEDARDAVAGFRDVVESLFQPVVTALVPLGLREVAGGGLGQPCQRDVRTGAETAGVHGRVDERLRGR